MVKFGFIKVFFVTISLFLSKSVLTQELVQKFEYKKPHEKRRMSGFEDYFSAAVKLSAITTNPSLNKDDSIAGPDLNNNGVRDDLDEYLASLEDSDINKKAIFNAFYAYQATINLKSQSEKDVKKAKLRMSDAIKGIVDAFGPKDAFDRLKIIEQYSINTDVRRKAYNEFEIRSAKSETVPVTPSESSISDAIDRLVAEGKYPRLNRDSDVAGPDVDGNGVRDDLDAYVASLPDTEDKKKAMLQGFKLYRYNVTADPSNIKDVERGMVLMSRAVSCIINTYGPRAGHKKLNIIRAYSLNTRYRFEAYVLFDKAKNGMSVSSDPNPCDE